MTQYQPPIEPWQMASASQTNAPKTAATFLWVLAGLLILFSGLMSLGLIFLKQAMPLNEFLKQAQAQSQSPEQLEMIKTIYEAAPILGWVCLFVGGLPAIAYLILGFFVQKPTPIASIICIVMLSIQSLFLLLMVLSSIAQAVVSGQIPALVMSLLMFALPVGLHAITLYHLSKVANPNRSALQSNVPHGAEPWD